MYDTIINVRAIQHYLYCPHRWGLIYIDSAWSENYYISKANILHKRVHSGDDYHIRGRKIYTRVSIWNDEYGLYGVTDCVEEKNSRYALIEYKPTAPKDDKYNPDDAMQVFAQKICFDSVFHSDCDAYIYYADKHKKVSLPFKDDYEKYLFTLKRILMDMRYCMNHNIIPNGKSEKGCSGCSMKDICMPNASKHKIYTKSQIKKLIEDI